MSTGLEKRTSLTALALVGLGLLAFPFLAPDAAHRWNGSFFRLAAATSWQNPGEWAAAWCSLKIICLSIGIFLVLESCGTMLARGNRRNLALSVYSFEIVAAAGALGGVFFLVKALL